MKHLKLSKGFFITGTDTEVGKTKVTELLLLTLQNKGYQVVGCKPIACGNLDDSLTYLQSNSLNLPLRAINPLYFSLAASPNIAAKAEKKHISAQLVSEEIYKLRYLPIDYLLVEGIGGWKVPLNEQETMIDVAKHLNLPVILVVGIRLGCLNHALLTAESIAREQLMMAGWIANIINPEGIALNDQISTLQDLLPAPYLGTIPFNEQEGPLKGQLDFSFLERSEYETC